MNFVFEMNQPATITVSGETGVVIARAEYEVGGNNYLLRYVAKDGRATEAWWLETALTAVTV